jgi:hypothetical protein
VLPGHKEQQVLKDHKELLVRLQALHRFKLSQQILHLQHQHQLVLFKYLGVPV